MDAYEEMVKRTESLPDARVIGFDLASGDDIGDCWSLCGVTVTVVASTVLTWDEEPSGPPPLPSIAGLHEKYTDGCMPCGVRKLAYMPADVRQRTLDAIQYVSGPDMRQEATRMLREEMARIKDLRAKALV